MGKTSYLFPARVNFSKNSLGEVPSQQFTRFFTESLNKMYRKKGYRNRVFTFCWKICSKNLFFIC